MEQIQWKARKIIDAHVHFRNREPVEHFMEILRLVNYDGINILGGPQSTPDIKKKALGTTYMFRMLRQDAGKIAAHDGKYLVPQVDEILSAGYDGIKMMDGKPQMRRTWQPLALDDDYFKPYWDKAETDNVPITIHVCDPLDYWNPEKENSYADLEPQEEFFRQAIAVLERNPGLNICFAHFLFMGPQLDRLGELFERFSRMRVDMAMGHEFLYYMSDDPDKSRRFCIEYSDRILYGTDISDHNSLRHGRSKAETLRLFLETSETFDNLIYEAMGKEPQPGSNDRLELHGLELPREVLDNILWRNFENFVGSAPKPLP